MEFHKFVFLIYAALLGVSFFVYLENNPSSPSLVINTQDPRYNQEATPPAVNPPQEYAPISVQEFNASSLLHRAAALGDEPQVMELLSAQYRINQPNGYGQTPLFFAVRCGREKIVLKLLEQEADVDWEDKKRWTPIFHATDLNHTRIIELLVRWRADYLRRDNGDLSPLHLACKRGNVKFVHFLLENGADVNVANSFAHWTPLHYAAQNGHTEIVKLLLQYGASPNVFLAQGWSPADLARGHGHVECVRLLSDHAEMQGQPVVKQPVEINLAPLQRKD